MNDVQRSDVASRDELVQRLALMEAMIAEGRRRTARYGWVFVLWGMVYIIALGWMILLPWGNWAWPVCIVGGFVLSAVLRIRQQRTRPSAGSRERNINSVWNGMGIAVTLYAVAAVWAGHGSEPVYVAAILFMVGMAHGISALILRWAAQGAAAATWWGCGVVCCFATTARQIEDLFLVAAFFGMVLFGLYAMMLERKRSSTTVQQHA